MAISSPVVPGGKLTHPRWFRHEGAAAKSGCGFSVHCRVSSVGFSSTGRLSRYRRLGFVLIEKIGKCWHRVPLEIAIFSATPPSCRAHVPSPRRGHFRLAERSPFYALSFTTLFLPPDAVSSFTSFRRAGHFFGARFSRNNTGAKRKYLPSLSRRGDELLARPFCISLLESVSFSRSVHLNNFISHFPRGLLSGRSRATMTFVRAANKFSPSRN